MSEPPEAKPYNRWLLKKPSLIKKKNREDIRELIETNKEVLKEVLDEIFPETPEDRWRKFLE